VGDLVYTSFSGSHQDAIKKGMYAQQRSETGVWDVPYLPIDPADLGRSYEAIIRVNSQSGKGGVAYLMESEHHLELPRGLQVDFAQKVQAITDSRGDELTADELLAAFHEHYLSHVRPYELGSYTHSSGEEDAIAAEIAVDGAVQRIQGTGNGPIAALVDAFDRTFGISIRIRDYHEHAMAAAADATAAAYIEADVDDDPVWGVGLHPSIATASLRALVNAVNRALALRAAIDDATMAFKGA
jgi:2-isopropylmalate synthase